MLEDHMEVDIPQIASGEKVPIQDDLVDKLIDILKQVSKSTSTLDARYIWKSLKDVTVVRHDINAESLSVLIELVYPDDSVYKGPLLNSVKPNSKPVMASAAQFRSQYPASFYQLQENGTTFDVSSELNSFIHYLVQLLLFDANKMEELQNFCTDQVIPTVLKRYNNRILDLVNSKLWFYVCRASELSENPNDRKLIADMMQFLKTATLKHDNETRATLITSILRQYLRVGEVELAADFVSKVDFPPGNSVSNPLEARYYFYLSKINAIQLDYSQSNEFVIAAIRKAPHTKNSLGFLQQANKLQCCIQLLMGDIPELSFFNQPGLEQSLLPYYNITKAVKLGDLNLFTSSLSKYKKQLVQDSNYQLCVRLRSNVIKTGIRMISLAYKRISLRDICLKLQLDSEQTAEYMVSRAIRDGVIEAKINHEKGFIETGELLNIYNTNQPQRVLDERIKFANRLHSEYVTSMRFPDARDKKLKGTKDNTSDDFEGSLNLDVMDLSDLDSDLDDML